MPAKMRRRLPWLPRLSITQQFVLVALLGVSIPLMAIGFSLRTSYVMSFQAKQAETKNLVDAAVSATEGFVRLAQQGDMTTAQAQQDALAFLGAAQFDQGNYFFVLDKNGITEFPAARAMTEKALAANPYAYAVGSAKISGGPLVVAALAGKPIFVQYYHTKLGGTKLLPKLSYAELVPQWGWVIGTGVYIDDLHTNFLLQLAHLAWMFLPLVAAFIALIFMMRRTYMTTMERHLTAKALETKNAVLSEMSSTDWLTGTANRRAFDAQLKQNLTRARETGLPIALIMLDVDHFKSYNDSFGHQAGDTVLRELAGLMMSQLRDGRDILARYGGEEFAVIMPGIDRDQAAKVAERIRSIIEAAGLPHGGPGAGRFVTISIGIAVAVPGDEHTEMSLIEAADKALYKAKHDGRNIVAMAAG